MKGYLHTVAYYETDKMGVTHHSNYVRWMEEARVDFLDKAGWGYDRLEALGVISPVVGLSCNYKAPTTFRDVIEVRAKVAEYNGVRLVVAYEMVNAETGRTVFTGTSTHCFQDQSGRIIRRMAQALPGLDEALRRSARQ